VPGIARADLRGRVGRGVVDHDDREIAPGLREQRLDRLGEMGLAVVGGEAEYGARNGFHEP
jgi:hypothetical protein